MKNNAIRITAILIINFCAIGGLMAQGSLGKGNKQLNAGVGFSSWGVPIYAGLDFGVHPDITIGPQVSFRSYSERYRANGTNYRDNHSIFVIGFNGNYHFNSLLELDPEWDIYAGLTLGYYIWSSPDDYLGRQDSSLGMVGQIGARYFFSDKFGMNLEFGGGIASGGKLGITLKL